VRVFVSGLPYENRDFKAEIMREGEKLLSRLDKSFEVTSIVFHIKKEGSGFSIRSRLDGRKSLIASATDFRLETALHKVIDELRKMAEKGKMTGIEKKRRDAKMNEL
jgi:ribosome-associated translation inhibitor RaiA